MLCIDNNRIGGIGYPSAGTVAEKPTGADSSSPFDSQTIRQRGAQRRDSCRSRSEDDRILQQRRHRDLHPHRHEHGMIAIISFFHSARSSIIDECCSSLARQSTLRGYNNWQKRMDDVLSSWAISFNFFALSFVAGWIVWSSSRAGTQSD